MRKVGPIYVIKNNRFLKKITQEKPDDKTRREQRDNSRTSLHKLVHQGFSNPLDLQAAMADYLQIREHEEALHLPATPVPVILIPYFQNITHPNLEVFVNRLAV